MVVADVVPQPVASHFHVFVRDQDHNLVRVDLDPAPTVAEFIGDCMDVFFEGDEEDNPSESELYLSTVGGRILPKTAMLDAVVANGQTVVLNLRGRGGMQDCLSCYGSL